MLFRAASVFCAFSCAFLWGLGGKLYRDEHLKGLSFEPGRQAGVLCGMVQHAQRGGIERGVAAAFLQDARLGLAFSVDVETHLGYAPDACFPEGWRVVAEGTGGLCQCDAIPAQSFAFGPVFFFGWA